MNKNKAFIFLAMCFVKTTSFLQADYDDRAYDLIIEYSLNPLDYAMRDFLLEQYKEAQQNEKFCDYDKKEEDGTGDSFANNEQN